jgi:hypothetical protein
MAAAGVILCAGIASALWLTGCGTPGAPQPPSLKLPEPVNDLTAVRAGGSVTLHWTMPKKSTDRLLLKEPVPVQICWRQGSGDCQTLGHVTLAPGSEGDFQGQLPAALLSGDPRPVSCFVELKSPKGRSAGLSNPAVILAGTAPAAISGLTAEVRADGVALHWGGVDTTAVRLHRKLLSAPKPEEKTNNGPMKRDEEPVLRDLLVETPATEPKSGALDKTARFGEVYEYTVQRVARVTVDGKTEELAGAVSAPVKVDVIDTFPPAVPQGLVAVLVPEAKTIDLSWQPDTDEDLAGYIVYRTEGDAPWKRISGEQPLIGPAFRDPKVEAGHSYRYSVSAIDLTGHESRRSAEAQESLPNP